MPNASFTKPLYLKAEKLLDAGNFSEAIAAFEKLYYQKATVKNVALLQRAANRLGICYNQQGNISKAEYWFGLSLQHAPLVGNHKALSSAHTNLATTLAQLGKTQKAVEHLQAALTIMEQNGNQQDMGRVWLQLSGVFFSIENNKSGEEALHKAERLIHTHKQHALLPHLHFSRAMHLNRSGLHPKALKEYETAAQYALQANDKLLAGRCYNNQASILMEQAKWSKAEKTIHKALQIARENKQGVDELLLSCHLAKIALEKGNTNEAEKLLGYVSKHAHGIANYMVVTLLNELNARCSELKGDTQQALKHYKAYIDSYKEAYDNEQSRTVLDMQAKYESEKRERELQEARLQQAQSELKALRSQMNPHFIFNALSGIRQSMLEEDTDEADRLIIRFSKLLRLILDTSRKPDMLLSQNIELLHLYIQVEQSRQNNRFSYTIDVDKSINPDSVSVNGLILQPLAENAILHGLFHKNEGEGKLAIRFRKSKNALCAEITDNGIGRTKAAQYRKKGHASHATAMIKETLQLLWKTDDISPYLTITDLYHRNKKPAGTSVKVYLPLNTRLENGL